jgi:hypothetical protein
MDIIKSTTYTTNVLENNNSNNNIKYEFSFLIISLISVAIIQISIMFEYLLFRRKIHNIIITMKKDNYDKNIQIEKDIHNFIKSQNIELEEKMKIAYCNLYGFVKSKHIESEEYIKKIEDKLYDLVKSHQINFEEQLKNVLDLNNDKTKLLQQQFSGLKENVDNISEKIDILNENQHYLQLIEEIERKCQCTRNIMEEYIISNKKLLIDIYKFYKTALIYRPPPMPNRGPRYADPDEDLKKIGRLLDCIYYKYLEYDTSEEIYTEMRSIVEDTYRNEPILKKQFKKEQDAREEQDARGY